MLKKEEERVKKWWWWLYLSSYEEREEDRISHRMMARQRHELRDPAGRDGIRPLWQMFGDRVPSVRVLPTPTPSKQSSSERKYPSPIEVSDDIPYPKRQRGRPRRYPRADRSRRCHSTSQTATRTAMEISPSKSFFLSFRHTRRKGSHEILSEGLIRIQTRMATEISPSQSK